MLGIGMQEMLIIGLAALLIFGPGKLPEVMGQAGKLYKDFRNMTSELTGEFEKTVAEAKEMGNQLTGDLGPMQKQVDSVTKSVQRDLGKASKSSPATKSTTSTSTTAKKATTTSTSTKTTSGKSTTSSRTSATKTAPGTSKTTDTAKKAVAPVATREDPAADVSVFMPTEPERVRRTRRATPSVITDRTPRAVSLVEPDENERSAVATAAPVDDAIARARQRRRAAGYAQRSA